MKNLFKALLVLSIFAACNGGEKQTNGVETGNLEGTVQIDGSSTVYPISEAVAEEFRATNSDVKVTIGVSGTGGGFKKFLRKELDVTNASRPIKPEEAQAAKDAGVTYIELPIAYDGLAVVIHPENDWVDHMTVEELKKLWEPAAQKKIKKWNQIRPNWPNEEIHLYGAGTESGTYDYFTEAIVGESKASRGDYTASEDDNVLVQGVSTDKYALGFFGLAYYEENTDKLKVVAIEDGDQANGEGPVTPTPETVQNGTYQPLSRPLFIYVTTEAANRPEVSTFVEFYIENAGALSTDVGYIALPENVYKLVMERFKSRKTGSIFEGKESTVNAHLEELLK